MVNPCSVRLPRSFCQVQHDQLMFRTLAVVSFTCSHRHLRAQIIFGSTGGEINDLNTAVIGQHNSKHRPATAIISQQRPKTFSNGQHQTTPANPVNIDQLRPTSVSIGQHRSASPVNKDQHVTICRSQKPLSAQTHPLYMVCVYFIMSYPRL